MIWFTKQIIFSTATHTNLGFINCNQYLDCLQSKLSWFLENLFLNYCISSEEVEEEEEEEGKGLY